MRGIVGWSLKFRFLVVGIAVALIVFGAAQLRSMPVDVVPEFVPPYVQVETEALGLSAPEVEQLITVPLEADLLAGVAWLDRIESESVPGLSSVILYFEPGTDLFRARQVVAERLTQAPGLPHVSKPPAMLQPLSSTNRMMMVGLSSNDVSLIDMSVLARWTIRPRLMGVPGVANVAIWGQRERQLQVQVDPARLRDRGVSLAQVISTAGNALWVSPLSFLEASTPGTGGFIDTPNQRLSIQHLLPISSAEDLAKVALERDGTQGLPSPLRLGDVANVVEDHQPLIGDAVVNDGAGLFLVVEKFPGANTLAVTQAVEEALDSLRPGLAGIEIDTSVFRPASFIDSAISSFNLAFLIAFLLVAIVLGVLLFDWRAGLIGLLAIPVSVLAAVVVLNLLGASLNIMIIAGLLIAVAVVVDDAVVGTEHVMRRLQKPRGGDSEKSTAAVVLEASLEVRAPLSYAVLIIAVALVPLWFVSGAAGAFLPDMAVAYATGVLASLIVALTVTPALTLILLSRWPAERRESPVLRGIQRVYGATLAQIVNRQRTVFAAAGAVLLAGLLVVPLTTQSLIPTFKDRDLLIHFDGPPGTSQPEMSRIIAEASTQLRTVPGVRSVGGHVGRAIEADQVVGTNSAELWVNIDAAADYDATRASVQRVVDSYPGLRRKLTTFPNERIDQVLTAGDKDLVVRIYGEDLSVLRAKAAEAREAFAKIDGVAVASVESPPDQPTLQVQVDLDEAQRYGIKAGEVRRAATTLLSGLTVGSLFEDQKVFDVVVVGTPEIRHSLTSVRELRLDTPSGNQVQLGDVASVQIASAPTAIEREGVARRIDVGIQVLGRDVSTVAKDVEAAIASIEFPLEHHAELLPDYLEQQAARDRLVAFGIAAAIAVFLLLQAAFNSWRLAVLTFVTLPIALVGGLLLSFLLGGVFSLGSLVGFFTVFALTTRSEILLINHYRLLEREPNGAPFGPWLVLRGARERLAPTLTTAVATAVAVTPFAILGGLPGYELVHPMAVVILGGLVTATLLNLFVVPVLYLISRPRPEEASSAEVFEQPGLSPA